MITFIEYNNIGAVTDVAGISASGTIASYTIPAGKKGISFQNVGNKIAWYGGSTVDPTTNRGNKLFQNQSLVYKNVKNSFEIYFKCAAGETTIIGVVLHA